MTKPLDRARSLRAQLTLLCLGLLVPTLVFVGVLFWRISQSEIERAEQEARSRSHALANALDREVIGVLTTLQALATSPSLQTGDLPGFYRQISEMRRLQQIHISLRDVTGHALMTTRVPFGDKAAVPPPLAAADQEVLRSDKPMVTDMFTGTTAAAAVFQIITAPVAVEGRPTYLIGASMDPDYLEGVFRREILAAGWTGSLVDRNFVVVARTAEQAAFVGRLASADLRSHAAAESSGIYYGRTITGTDSLVGFTHSALTGWTVSVNVPTAVVTAPMRRSLLLLLVLGTVLIAFAGLLAVTAGRRIIRAIQRLRAAADAIGRGQAVTNVQTPIAEINVVGQALYFAAAQLHARAEERDAAEASVRNSETHLSGIFAQTGAGLAEAELDGRIISANDHYCALVGRTTEEVCRMRLRDIPHPDDAEINDSFFRDLIETGEPVTVEKRFMRKDGSVVWVANTLSLIRGARDTLLSVAIDISEQKRVEADLQAARDTAEQANLAKSTFIANMSHELRTPLSAIIGYSEMLREEVSDGADPAEFEADLGKIESNARHLLGLINDVLDLSKIESGKMEVFAERFEVEPMVRDVAATVDSLVHKKGNRLEVAIGAGLGAMNSDITKIRQTLLNLLSNAAKFTENGTITLSVEREGEFVVFGVTDSGIGMTEEQLGKLFQRFSQADASTTRRFGGTGLGLSITKAFTSMLGGSIDVSSQEGRGSRFTVRLPTELPMPGAADAAEFGEGASEAVLVIDDDPAQRDIMSRFLEREGFTAHTAANGAAGLEMARRLRPRAILLDVTMPGMDGWSVLRALKAEPDLADIPVVMVTFIDDNGLSTALGASDHITKPVKWNRFRTTMAQFHAHEGDVLIVDDNAETRRMMRTALERDGWSVAEAQNGAEALRLVSGTLPMVVLLDLEMPVMDGFAFLHAFRELPGCRDIPVIVITARDLSRADRADLQGASKVMTRGETSLAALSTELKTVTRDAPHHTSAHK